jgi:hypothetical protein
LVKSWILPLEQWPAAQAAVAGDGGGLGAAGATRARQAPQALPRADGNGAEPPIPPALLARDAAAEAATAPPPGRAAIFSPAFDLYAPRTIMDARLRLPCSRAPPRARRRL